MVRNFINPNGKSRFVLNILMSKWFWLVIGSIGSFLLGDYLLTGWANGKLIDLSYPYSYDKDALFVQGVIKRIIEGWYFFNPRSGYPYGSYLYDYSISNFSSFLIIKLLSLFTTKYYVIFDLFTLLSFPAAYVAALIAFQRIGISLPFSVSASFLFSFLPYHFIRLNHSYLLWYFVVPIFYILYFSHIRDDLNIKYEKIHIGKTLFLILGTIFISSFSIYYAFFGFILLSMALFYKLINKSQLSSLLSVFFNMFMVIMGVLWSIGPNLIYKYQNGPNLLVANRPPSQSEVYALKLINLLLPRIDHRFKPFSALTALYIKTPTISDTSPALGIIGSLGFIILFIMIIIRLSNKPIELNLSLLALPVFVFFLLGTLGGFGTIFSYYFTSSLREWNRVSVFIAFGSLAGFFLFVQNLIEKNFSKQTASAIILGLAIFLCGAGLYDQTISADVNCGACHKNDFLMDRTFISDIEKALPKNSAIYQLPYAFFPEAGYLNDITTYNFLSGFINSNTLNWSYGNIPGREGDQFFRKLSKEPIGKQVEIITSLGFDGVYIDRRAYKDNAEELVNQLDQLLGTEQKIYREDKKIIFYPIK